MMIKLAESYVSSERPSNIDVVAKLQAISVS